MSAPEQLGLFACVPLRAATDADMSAGCYRLLIAVARRAGPKGWCTAGRARLAADTGLHPTTISQYLRELKSALYVLPRAAGRKTHYRILHDNEFATLAGANPPRWRKGRTRSIHGGQGRPGEGAGAPLNSQAKPAPATLNPLKYVAEAATYHVAEAATYSPVSVAEAATLKKPYKKPFKIAQRELRLLAEVKSAEQRKPWDKPTRSKKRDDSFVGVGELVELIFLRRGRE